MKHASQDAALKVRRVGAYEINKLVERFVNLPHTRGDIVIGGYKDNHYFALFCSLTNTILTWLCVVDVAVTDFHSLIPPDH